MVADMFVSEHIHRVLDLGSGGGRHTLYFAAKGFDMYALDSAPTGLAHTLKLLDERHLSAHLALHDAATLPYDDSFFDAVIGIQVIHHNMLEGVKRTIAEIARVLRPNGLIWITMPVSQNEPSTSQNQIEPGTFIPLNGREKGLPHHYFSSEEIPILFRPFSLLDLHIDDVNHFSLLGRKAAT